MDKVISEVWSVFYGDYDSGTSFEGTEQECRDFYAKFGEECVHVNNEFDCATYAILRNGPNPEADTIASWEEG